MMDPVQSFLERICLAEFDKRYFTLYDNFYATKLARRDEFVQMLGGKAWDWKERGKEGQALGRKKNARVLGRVDVHDTVLP